MIPEITREEHYYILNQTGDGIGYCHQMFNMKTENNMGIGPFAMQLKMWIQRQTKRRMDLLEGSEHIKKYFSEKFA